MSSSSQNSVFVLQKGRMVTGRVDGMGGLGLLRDLNSSQQQVGTGPCVGMFIANHTVELLVAQRPGRGRVASLRMFASRRQAQSGALSGSSLPFQWDKVARRISPAGSLRRPGTVPARLPSKDLDGNPIGMQKKAAPTDPSMAAERRALASMPSRTLVVSGVRPVSAPIGVAPFPLPPCWFLYACDIAPVPLVQAPSGLCPARLFL